MKRNLFMLLSLAALYSCGEKTQPAPAPDTPPVTETVANTSADPIEEGKALIAGADCLGCHSVANRMTGPSYQEIAARYSAADQAKLVSSIINGSKGVWGPVEMTPHPGLSEENAQKMVTYILAQKK